MIDQTYSLKGKNLDDTYKDLQRDLGSISMQINKWTYIYPYPSDLQAIVNIRYQKEPEENIELKFMPAVPDEGLLKRITDIIKKYEFKLVNSEEAKEMLMFISKEK